MLQLQRRLRDVHANPRAQSALAHRNIFREALTWLEVHGGSPELVAQWNAVADQRAAVTLDPDAQADRPPRKRRRRRRRRFRPTPS
jgi:hypothetical protein